MDAPLKVVVVGAGITGVCAAEWMRRDGHDVTLIDRAAPGDPAQSSYGNAGILARCAVVPVSTPGLWRKIPAMLLDPDSPLHMRWAHLPRLIPWIIPFLRNGSADRIGPIAEALENLLGDSVDQHLSLARGTPAEKWIATGEYLYLYKTRAEFKKDAYGFALRKAHGFEWEERERPALVEADPHLGPDYAFAAAFKDHGWIRDPGRYVADLAAWFEGQGGAIMRADVAGAAPIEGGRAAVVAGGTRIEADRVVIAAGAWSARLARQLGCEPMLESERGYHLWLREPNITPPVPYMITDAKFALTPMAGGLRCAGQVEFGGLDAPASAAPLALFRKTARRIYPSLRWARADEWLGHRPSTVDSLPLIGPAPSAPGVLFAFGTQHVGLTAGPKTGRIIANIVAGRPSNIDLTPYRVGRFGK